MDSWLDVIPLLVMLMIPLVAILGGITAGIIKNTMRQRMLELAQKERIAAIERGLDPEKLPPLQLPPGYLEKPHLTMEQRSLRRSHLLTIAGLLVAFFGFAFLAIGGATNDDQAFAPGMVFVMLGIGLLLGSRVGRPSKEEVRKSVEEEAARMA
ncbi:MAG TPA: hypothetical protein VKU85_08595 [bacterium]|nr:hypothetical protein [bacterium]